MPNLLNSSKGSSMCIGINTSLAQWIEHLDSSRKVAGSSPAGGSLKLLLIQKTPAAIVYWIIVLCRNEADDFFC